jgi:KaiC/GvpD/RAD55 family RecA-like ATPase
VREQLTVSVGPANAIGNRNVDARYGELLHPGHFNPADDQRRRAFAEDALELFGWKKTPEHYAAFSAAILQELARAEKAERPPEERLNIAGLQSMQQDELTWLWPNRIAVGKLCVIAGDPGLGKSLLSLDIAAHASRGAPWPDESGFAPVTSIFLLSSEDDYVDTIRPRLVATEADLDRVFAITGVASVSGEAETERLLDISQDVEKLREALEALPEPRLLVIDPISSFLGSASENANSEIRKLLLPVTVLAQETKTAVVLISHLRKSEGSNLHRIIGSIAFAAVARSAFVVEAIRGTSGQGRRLVPVKSNLGAARTAITFRVEQHPEFSQPRIVWGGEEPHEGVEIPNVAPGRPDSLSPDAARYIRSRLSQGPATLSELREGLGELTPSRGALYRHINKHYGWLEERRGQEKLIDLREGDDGDCVP